MKMKHSAYIFTESNDLGLCKVLDKVYRPTPKMKMKYIAYICSPVSIGLHQGLAYTAHSVLCLLDIGLCDVLNFIGLCQKMKIKYTASVN